MCLRCSLSLLTSIDRKKKERDSDQVSNSSSMCWPSIWQVRTMGLMCCWCVFVWWFGDFPPSEADTLFFFGLLHPLMFPLRFSIGCCPWNWKCHTAHRLEKKGEYLGLTCFLFFLFFYFFIFSILDFLSSTRLINVKCLCQFWKVTVVTQLLFSAYFYLGMLYSSFQDPPPPTWPYP